MVDQELYITSGFIENVAHEAAHAVIGHVLGLHVEEIEVYQRSDEGGGAAHFAEYEIGTEAPAIMSAAGGAAVAEAQDGIRKHNSRARWVGDVEAADHVNTQWPDLSEEDRRVIRQYLERNYFSGVTGKREYNRIKAEARRLVRENWPAITQVMHALVEASEDRAGESTSRIDRAAFLKAVEAAKAE